MAAKLTHSDLIDLAQALGYEAIEGGVCQGFSMMLGQAIELDEEATFYKRMNFIAEYKAKGKKFSTLVDEINAVKEKLKQDKGHKLSDKEWSLLEVQAFYDGIAIYLNPEEHRDLFNDYLYQQEVDRIYEFAKAKKLEGTSLSVPLDHSNVFDKAELKEFLTRLTKILDKSNKKSPIILSNMGHAVCLSPSKKSKAGGTTWDYVDTNFFSSLGNHPDYFLTITIDQLTNYIFTSLSKDGKYLVCNLKLLDSKIDNQFNETLAKLDETSKILPKDIERQDNNVNLLHLACLQGNLKVVKRLIEMGSGRKLIDNDGKLQSFINIKDKSGHSPLLIASIAGHPHIVKYLLEKGADRDQLNSALYNAGVKNKPRVVKLLLDNGANPNVMGAKDDNTPPTSLLYQSCEKGYSEVFKHLLDAGADRKQVDKSGNPLMYTACLHNQPKVVEVLMDKGEKINQICHKASGKTPLMVASISGPDVVKLLLTKGALVNQSDNEGNSSLHKACVSGRRDIVKLLLNDKNIKVNALNNDGNTPAHIACINGQEEVIKTLHDKGADLNLKNNDKNTPLHIVCLNKRIKVVQQLLENGARVNEPGQDGKTPMDIASSDEEYAIVLKELKLTQKLEIRNPQVTIQGKVIDFKHLKDSIEQMRQYAHERKDIQRGQKADYMVDTLTYLFNSFMQNKKVHTPDGCKQFLGKCNKILKIYKQMDDFKRHRSPGKILLANIAFALTGIGAVLLAIKATHSYVTTGRAAGFFAKTQGQQNIEAIEKHAAPQLPEIKKIPTR